MTNTCSDELKSSTGVVRTYHDDKQTKLYEEYFQLNDKKNGIYKTYWANGQLCEEVKSLKIPTEISTSEFKNCDPSDYFYGLNGHKVNYEKSRKCGLIRLQNGDTNNELVNNSDILAMIYANGYGVEENRDLAIKFACENEGPSSILAVDSDEEFDFCNYITDPNTEMICNYQIPAAIKKSNFIIHRRKRSTK